MEPMTQERAIHLSMGEYGEETLKLVASFVAPIFWVRQADDGTDIINNGSMFFIDAGQGLFAVTANHVFEAYLKAKRSSPRIKCEIVPNCFEPPGRETVSFDPEASLIDSDPEFDIATFQISPAEMEQIGSTVLTTWPPMVPQMGFGVAFAGFPGHERRIVGPREICFRPFPVLAVPTSVNDRLISCQTERDSIVKSPGFSEAPPNYDTSGMSGGPLLTHIEQNGLYYWRLGGVIREGNKNMEIIFASRAECLLPDGNLAR